MPLLVISPRQRQAELARAAQAEDWERRHRRENLVVLLLCVAWNVIGLVIMGLSMMSADVQRAQGWFAVGAFVGYGGMAVTLLVRFVHLAERGDI